MYCHALIIEDVLTLRYDLTSSTTSSIHQQLPPDAEIALQKVVISNIDGHTSSNRLQVAPSSHIQKKGGYLKFSHEANPENKFANPQLFPKLYAMLYPFGVGGLEDLKCKEPMCFKWHIKHFLNLTNH